MGKVLLEDFVNALATPAEKRTHAPVLAVAGT
jgi:hypothetical protein